MFNLDPTLKQDTVFVSSLALSDVLLMNDSQYPWFILVPRVEDVTEIIALSAEQRAMLYEESHCLSKMLVDFFKVDKLNIAALGNVVAQLHIHHVGRFRDDVAWPRPVWGVAKPVPYTVIERSRVIEQALDYLENFA